MVSRTADACPNCARRLKRRWYEVGPFTIAVVFLSPVIVLLIVGQCSI